MKKILVIFAVVFIAATAKAYDFSAVAPSGQTLYYKIVNGNAAQVTHPGPVTRSSNMQHTITGSWGAFSTPAGDLIIPDTVENNGNRYPVTAIDKYAFCCCNDILSVRIPNTCRSLGDCCFLLCKGIRYFTIGNMVNSIGDSVFFHCQQLQNINIPNSVYYIGKYAFSCCYEMDSIHLPNTINIINPACFLFCYHLKSIDIPGSVGIIGSLAFASSGMASVNIPSTVTNIASDAFGDIPNINYNGSASGAPWGALCLGAYYEDSVWYYNSSKKEVVAVERLAVNVNLPSSVEKIRKMAFYNCEQINALTLNSTVPPVVVDSVVFRYVSRDINIVVPCESIGDYINADVWNLFTNITCDYSPEPDSTAIEDIENTYTIITAEHGRIMVSSPSNIKVSITSVDGKNIYKNNCDGTMVIPVHHGVYFVRVGNQRCKKVIVY